MRKAVLGTVGFLLFCVGWAFGQQSVFNGTGWKNANLDQRVFYIRGFTEGHYSGMIDGSRVILEAVKTAIPSSAWTQKEKIAFLKKLSETDHNSAAQPHFSVRQIESTTSTFYDDYRNVPVCWYHAVQFSVSSLEGNAPSETDLDRTRKSDAESGCR